MPEEEDVLYDAGTLGLHHRRQPAILTGGFADHEEALCPFLVSNTRFCLRVR